MSDSGLHPSIADRLAAFVRTHGPWTAHNVDLGEGVSTMGERPLHHELALRRIVQVAADTAGRPLRELRVLDLGCNEGLFAIEFARHGAEAVGIEGRESNLARARFVKEVLGLERLHLHCDDARSLSESKYGRFDVVLCLGLLYHLDEPAVFDFVRSMADVCDRTLIVHTQVSMAPKLTRVWRGRSYSGRSVLEHLPGEDAGAAGWSSLDNVQSFWITRSSLINLMMDVGFTTVTEVRVPFLPWQPDDHVTLVGIRGERIPMRSSPRLDGSEWERRPERRRTTVSPAQLWYFRSYRRMLAALPPSWRARAKRLALRLRRALGLWWATPGGR